MSFNLVNVLFSFGISHISYFDWKALFEILFSFGISHISYFDWKTLFGIGNKR